MTSTPAWLRRYINGEHDAVWQELHDLGDRVREPQYADEAQAVCDEMARRARANIEVIIGRLTEQGYRFHDNTDEQTTATPLTGPASDADAFLTWLEDTVGGPVPMVLSSWVRFAGDVWLVGTHPQWSTSAGADPLVIEITGARYPGHDMRTYLLEELEAWQETADEDEPFQLPVAPDQLHKDNTSGGAPYGIELPDAGADARIVVDDEPMPFITYLRHVFAAGGFPAPTGDPAQDRISQSLAEGLQPI